MRKREELMIASSFLDKETLWKHGTFYLEGDYRRRSKYGGSVVDQILFWIS